jgi:hypothetical protein
MLAQAGFVVMAPAPAAPLAPAPSAGAARKIRIKEKMNKPDVPNLLVPKPAPEAVPIDAGLERYAEPKIDFENSRHQVLGRTGFRGKGQSVKFEYKGPGGINADATYNNIAEATTAGKAWVVSERKRQRLD